MILGKRMGLSNYAGVSGQCKYNAIQNNSGVFNMLNTGARLWRAETHEKVTEKMNTGPEVIREVRMIS